MKKRGIETSTGLVAGMILLLVVLIVFLVFQSNILGFGEQKTPKAICKQSVYSSNFLGRTTKVFSEINCPTQYVEVGNSDELQAKAKLAGLMYDCWDQFGKGKLELFSGDNGVFCAVCHRITFTENKKINGFIEYLAETTIPLTKSSYLDYFTSYSTEGSKFLEGYRSEGLPQDSLDPARSNSYATIFFYIKGKDEVENYFEKTKSALPGVAIFAVGAGIMKVGLVTSAAISATVVGAPVGLILAKASIVVGGVVMLGGVAYSAIAEWYGGVEPEFISEIKLEPYNEQALFNLGCQILPAAEKAKVGT